ALITADNMNTAIEATSSAAKRVQNNDLYIGRCSRERWLVAAGRPSVGTLTCVSLLARNLNDEALESAGRRVLRPGDLCPVGLSEPAGAGTQMAAARCARHGLFSVSRRPGSGATRASLVGADRCGPEAPGRLFRQCGAHLFGTRQ